MTNEKKVRRTYKNKWGPREKKRNMYEEDENVKRKSIQQFCQASHTCLDISINDAMESIIFMPLE